jgi:hypothetical protein
MGGRVFSQRGSAKNKRAERKKKVNKRFFLSLPHNIGNPDPEPKATL